MQDFIILNTRFIVINAEFIILYTLVSGHCKEFLCFRGISRCVCLTIEVHHAETILGKTFII